jgi:uncharacterized linocin/CFP29 family protein
MTVFSPMVSGKKKMKLIIITMDRFYFYTEKEALHEILIIFHVDNQVIREVINTPRILISFIIPHPS